MNKTLRGGLAGLLAFLVAANASAWPAKSSAPQGRPFAAVSVAIPVNPAAGGGRALTPASSPDAAMPPAFPAAAAAPTQPGQAAPADPTSDRSGIEAVQRDRQAFDGAAAWRSGFVTLPEGRVRLPHGVRLDEKPRAPRRGAVVHRRVHLSSRQAPQRGATAIPLDADPKDPAAIEAALRKLVDSDPERFGAASADMAKVHVQLVAGDAQQDQADTFYAVFRQWKKGADRNGFPYYLLVDGASLTFNVKVIDGKPYVMVAEGRLYPDIDPAIMTPGFSQDQLLAIAAKRLQSPPERGSPDARANRRHSRRPRRPSAADDETEALGKPRFLTREITFVKRAWRAVNIYQAADLKGRPVIVAVDVHSGEAFAWDARSLLRSTAAVMRGIAGAVTAAATTLTATGDDHGPTKQVALPFAKVFDQDGKVVAYTDEEGRFTAPEGSQEAMTLTVRLEGRYATVFDHSKSKPVEATVTVKPGETVRIVLDTTDETPQRLAAVNGYVYYNNVVAWLKSILGPTEKLIDAPLTGGIHVNRTDLPGNAYENPADDSLNLQAEAEVKRRGRTRDGEVRTVVIRFENTAQPSIIYHESTHRAVQILSQLELTAEQAASRAFRYVGKTMGPIMGGGVNEAIADIVSMLMRGSPRVGVGLVMNPPDGKPSVIRDGRNDTQYDPDDPDPHAVGEPFMGFGWLVRQAVVKALGPAAGAAYAAALLVPTTLYAQPKDVPTAVVHVLLASMTKDGRLPLGPAIIEAAQAHGLGVRRGSRQMAEERARSAQGRRS